MRHAAFKASRAASGTSITGSRAPVTSPRPCAAVLLAIRSWAKMVLVLFYIACPPDIIGATKLGCALVAFHMAG